MWSGIVLTRALFPLILLALFLTCTTISAQPQNHWFVTLGTSYSEDGYVTVYGSDGYLYTLGVYENDFFDFFIAKLDPDNGDLIWATTFGTDLRDEFSDAILASDGFIYVAGYTRNADYQALIVKVNPQDGSVVWAKTFGGADALDRAFAITEGPDGYLYVTGDTRSYGSGAFVAKIDPSSGDIVDFVTVSGPGNIYPHSIITDDLGYIYIAGMCSGTTPIGYDAIVFKLDLSNREIPWYKVIDLTSEDNFYAAVLSDDGYLYVGGYSQDWDTGDYLSTFFKVNSADGSVIWFKAINLTDYGGVESVNDMLLGPDNYIWAVGKMVYNITVMKLSTDGDLILFKSINNTVEVRDITLSAEGYLYITGLTTFYGAGAYDAYVILFSANIASQLDWTGGEDWYPVKIFEPPTEVLTLSYNTISTTLSVTEYSVTPSTLTTFSSPITFESHKAVDSNVPIPIPELTVVGLVALLTALTIYAVLKKRVK